VVLYGNDVGIKCDFSLRAETKVVVLAVYHKTH